MPCANSARPVALHFGVYRIPMRCGVVVGVGAGVFTLAAPVPGHAGQLVKPAGR